MRIIYLSFFCLFLSCASSGNNSNSTHSKNLIPKEELISILEELILIETHLQSKYYSLPSYKESLFLSRDSLLKNKNITLKQFNDSFNQYSKSDKELITLYETVLNDLNEKAAKTIVKSK